MATTVMVTVEAATVMVTVEAATVMVTVEAVNGHDSNDDSRGSEWPQQ